ncbi:AAA family ATPase [Bosea sp. FBZP-16]|uniref:ParA family protein n=1 Tax=Bosea sp. FBZP-16 TaxID=2065382 RepID=UPI000C306CF4|nr:AAA family ATPase [Bosea sp. FBZP-16]
MIAQRVDLEEAIFIFASEVHRVIGPEIEHGRFVRDIFGRLSFITPRHADDEQLATLSKIDFRPIESFLDMGSSPIRSGSSRISEQLLSERGQVLVSDDGAYKFSLLDRRLAGDDWLQAPKGLQSSPRRIAFYGLKGGVGRSTALAISAADLAASGKNVLVVDLDLEAPGLGSILLREDFQPEFGVLDWLSFAASGSDPASIIDDMIGGSTFTTGSGVVDVIPAVGNATFRRPAGYFSKLARAYTPGSGSGKFVGLSFTDKIEEMLRMLLERRVYDAILIDVRAGLHETSASSFFGLGASVLLFGVASSQTISDYSILLSGIRQSMVSWREAPDIRPNFRMVQGRAGNTLGDQAAFKAACWQLWLDTLYDAVGEEADLDSYSFDIDDHEGPHFPWVIPNADSFLTFDPRRSAEFLGQERYAPVFGSFLANIRRMVEAGSLVKDAN